MAVISTQSVTTSGAALTYSAASGGGDRFTPDSYTFMHVVNGNAGTLTVTLVTPNTVDGLAIADRTVVVLTGASALIKLPISLYTSADGKGDVTWSVTSSVTFAVLTMA